MAWVAACCGVAEFTDEAGGWAEGEAAWVTARLRSAPMLAGFWNSGEMSDGEPLGCGELGGEDVGAIPSPFFGAPVLTCGLLETGAAWPIVVDAGATVEAGVACPSPRTRFPALLAAGVSGEVGDGFPGTTVADDGCC
jgi:hypothetical protein